MGALAQLDSKGLALRLVSTREPPPFSMVLCSWQF